MRPLSVILPITAFIALALFACRCPCSDSDLDLEFLDYDSTEVSTIIIRKYVAGSRFQQRSDTALFISEQHFRLKQNGNRITFPIRMGNLGLHPHADWVVFLPSVNREFQITDIKTEQEYQSCIGTKEGCGNPIFSAKIDGVIQNTLQQDYSVYLKK